MSNFRDMCDVFSDFTFDFDIFSDDETETKNWPQFYLERDIKNYYENEYNLFKNEMQHQSCPATRQSSLLHRQSF